MPLRASVPFSVLDGAPVAEGCRPSDALRHSVEVAQHAETWGYRRVWVTEHHSMPGVAASAPAVILAHLAAVTDRIRLGSGGVMLPNHAPLAVVEQFGTLEALAPGRIDLGLGRAPGAVRATAEALRRGGSGSGDDFVAMLAELLAFFDGSFPRAHPYNQIEAVPGLGDKPAIWLLGSKREQCPDRRRGSGCRSHSPTTSLRPTRFPLWRCTGSDFDRRTPWRNRTS